MARAIFDRPFRFDRRPKMAIAYDIKPSEEPQEFPGDVIRAAVKAGAAHHVRRGKPRRKSGNQAQQKGQDL